MLLTAHSLSIFVHSGGQSPTLQSKTRIPSTSSKIFYPDTGYNGLSNFTIQGDSNFVSSNIRKNTSIWNVTGTMEPAKTYTTKFSTARLTPVRISSTQIRITLPNDITCYDISFFFWNTSLITCSSFSTFSFDFRAIAQYSLALWRDRNLGNVISVQYLDTVVRLNSNYYVSTFKCVNYSYNSSAFLKINYIDIRNIDIYIGDANLQYGTGSSLSNQIGISSFNFNTALTNYIEIGATID